MMLQRWSRAHVRPAATVQGLETSRAWQLREAESVAPSAMFLANFIAARIRSTIMAPLNMKNIALKLKDGILTIAIKKRAQVKETLLKVSMQLDERGMPCTHNARTRQPMRTRHACIHMSTHAWV